MAKSVRSKAMAITAAGAADIAIIGGGPGGLACAAAIRAALGNDIRVTVRPLAADPS